MMRQIIVVMTLGLALIAPMTAFARGGHGGGGHGGGGGGFRGGGGGFHGGGGFRGGGGGSFRGGSIGAAHSGFSASAMRGGSFRAQNPAISRGYSGGVSRPGTAVGNINRGTLNMGASGRPGAATLSTRPNLGGANWGGNRPAIANGAQAPWAHGVGAGVGNRVGANAVNFNANHWNNWLGSGRYGYAAGRYGWVNRNNVWIRNNYWYGNYGYRWNRGYWPWWYRVGFWPGWGVGGYGYGGYGYYNPYYTASAYGPLAYDYAQPLPVAPTDDAMVPQSTAEAAMAQFDSARAEFKQGDANAALADVDAAIRLAPSDSQLHEFRALILFHQGNYQEAAATLYPVLAAGPGFNWDTVWSLYPSYETYERDLRSLAAYVRSHESEAPARFLLAYHKLVTNQLESAQRDLTEVVRLQPQDKLSQSLLDALNQQNQPQPATIPSAPPAGVQ